MKYLFAIKGLNAAVGGAERVFCTICSELAVRGHEVVVLTFDQPGGRPFYPLDARIRRIDLGIGDPAAQTGLADFLRRMPALRRAVVAEHPLAVVGFMHSIFVPLAIALAGTSIPLIGSEHIVPEHYKARPLQYALMLAIAPLLCRITVLSEAIRSGYSFLLRKRMISMPNPVTPPAGQAAPGLEKERYLLLNVARFDEQKDQATLLQAFALLADKHKDWDLKLIGDGQLRPSLEKLVDDLGLEGRVSMPGTTSDIATEYRAADIFVISSRYEAFGLVTAEAMSYGLPAVGFCDCPGTNELIQDGVNGLLAIGGTDRSASLAAQLDRLMTDPGMRSRLGNGGKSTISEKFSNELVCDKWETLLLDLNAGKNA